ncbi:unnamed protein product [Blepharisma stoltei]|uniref:RCC1-like domain-containing protein n=1 Tax=Blepharisma stoltei TaxID=1481888 RepID=A0AAU9ILE4_9CILI|nr:unnamed protein product [Blepharisma stoltei]
MDIESDEQVLVCGSGECEQLGIPNVFNARKPRLLKLPESVTMIACGSMHTLALTSEGRVYSWGCNDDGALGRIGEENIPMLISGVEFITKVTAGDSHSIALSANTRKLYSWGTYRNSQGNMEIGHKFPIEIGSDEFKKSKLIKDIVSGANHSLILADNRVYAWGDSEFGQIGRMPRSRKSIAHSLQIESIGMKNIEHIYSGKNHSFAKSSNNKVYGWGLNNFGQLGDGSTKNTCVPHEIFELRNLDIQYITGGDNHTLALLQNGRVLIWGRNDDYQLGLNTTESHYTPQEIPSLTNVRKIACGPHFNFAITSTQRIYSWGFGDTYVLLNGKEKNVSMPTLVAWSVAKPIEEISAGSQHVVTLMNPAVLTLPDIKSLNLKRKISPPRSTNKRPKKAH